MSDNKVRGLSFEDYAHAEGWSELMSCSELLHGNRRTGGSMLRLRACLDGLLPYRDSDALAFGRAAHCRLLEPERYTAEYAVVPEFERTDGLNKTRGWKNSNDYKGQLHEWGELHQNKERLTQQEADNAEAIASRVSKHQAVGLVRAHGGVEVSIRGELMGVPAKARLDKLSDDDTFIADVKTTRDIAPHALERSILQYSYHIKAAWYRDLYHNISGHWPTWVWIFIENAAPYDIAVWQPSNEDLAIGRAEYRSILGDYKRAIESDIWSGIAEDIEHRGLPEWYVKQFADSGELEMNDG